jgi:hypothetical protein
MTAEHAHGADGGAAAGRPDPGIRRALVTEAAACRLAVQELARDPGSGPALEMARLTLAVLEELGERAFAEEAGDAVIEAMCARAVAEDRAARPRALRALP